MSQQLLQHSKLVVNIFGAVGYTLLIIICIISTGALVIGVFSGGYVSLVDIPADTTQSDLSEADSYNPSLFVSILSALITAFMAVTSIFVLITLPYWIGKLGSRLLKRAIRFCQIPVTVLSLMLAKLIACGLAFVPSSMLFMYNAEYLSLAIVAYVLAISAMIVFIFQHSLAKMSRFDAKNIW